jgi:hypothetical protein
MVYRGHVENGVIRWVDAPLLSEGMEVEVRLLVENHDDYLHGQARR